jgi:hypothetical protein
MKPAFAALPTLDVALKRDSGEVDADGKSVILEHTVTLRPWALGFPEYIDRVYPAPVQYENMQPVEDAKQMSEYASRRALILLARTMDQIETKPPEGADRKAWDAYAVAIQEELAGAGLIQGDVSELIAAAMKVNRGSGKLPKA